MIVKFITPPQNECFQGILKSACLFVCVSMYPCLGPSVYKMLVILCRILLLQFCFNSYKTLHICWSYIEGLQDAILTLYQTTNFRLFQTESLQMIISNLTKMAESYPNG